MAAKPRCKLCGKQHGLAEAHDLSDVTGRVTMGALPPAKLEYGVTKRNESVTRNEEVTTALRPVAEDVTARVTVLEARVAALEAALEQAGVDVERRVPMSNAERQRVHREKNKSLE